MRRLIDNAKSFLDRQGIMIGLAMSLAWWGGNDSGDPYGGLEIFGLAFVVSVTWDSVAGWLRSRRTKPAIGMLHQRPHLTDYRRVLLVPREMWDEDETPMTATRLADLIICDDDYVVKDRYGVANLVHPGLWRAATVLPGSQVLNLSNPYVMNRVADQILEKAGREDLWGFPLEVVSGGKRW